MLYLIKVDKYLKKNKEQLWEEDHKTFYWWIGALFLSLTVIIGFLIAMLVIFVNDRDQIAKLWLDDLNNSSSSASLNNKEYVDTQLTVELVKQIFYLITFSASLGLLGFTFFKSVKSKTFANLSSLPTGIIFFLSFLTFFDFLNLLVIRGNIAFGSFLKYSNYFIFSFIVVKVIYILVWFLVSRNVSLIRRLFTRAETLEKMETFFANHPEAEAMRNQGYGFPNNQAGANSQAGNSEINNRPNSSPKSAKENDPIYQRLISLDEKGLHQVAKQLSISGYDAMEKNELINVIYLIYKNMQSDQKSKEIEVEPIKKETSQEIEKTSDDLDQATKN